MPNTCIGRFTGIPKTLAPVRCERKFKIIFKRILSTCALPARLPQSSTLIDPHPSLILTSCIAPSNAPQRSAEWFSLRKDKLTTSTFSTALGLWKGKRRYELWHEKVFSPDALPIAESSKRAMDWGALMEEVAIQQYKSITGREVGSLGFALHSDDKFDWVGASPDGLLQAEGGGGGGILEVKCPYNKGKPEKGLPWSAMPFYYMPQVQGQMEIMNRDWADLYCWTPNGSTIFRVGRDRGYWELMCGILWEFWWKNVVPAREALLLGREEEEVKSSYIPTSTHQKTGLVIARSLKLAKEARLWCRDIAGHTEFHQ